MKKIKDILNVGIVGFGIVGKRRKFWIDKNDYLKTIAVCDTRFNAKGEMVSVKSLDYKYDKSQDGTYDDQSISGNLDDDLMFFKNYKNLIDSCNLDMIFVCVPNYLAAEITIYGLKCGLHVFCEKPPGKSVEDIEMVRLVEKQNPNLKLKYGFNHRYHHSIIDSKKIIDSGELGRVINLRGIYGKSSIVTFPQGWRSNKSLAGGGILLDQGIHMLDMVRYFSGDFDECKSFVSNNYWSHDVEDNAYALLKNSKKGTVAMVHSTGTQWQHKFGLELSLEKGTLELSGILSGSKSYGQEKLRVYKKDQKSGEIKQTLSQYLEDDSWRIEIDEFVNSILNDRSIINGTSHDALMVMKMVFSIYKADDHWWDYFNTN